MVVRRQVLRHARNEQNRQLKDSYASDEEHRKLVVAYVGIGEAEDWRWYWTWSTDWDCEGSPPADWPECILACDLGAWTGNYPVAYWDEDCRDVRIYGKHTGNHRDRDHVSVLDEVIKDKFDGIYLDWVEGYEEAIVAAAREAGLDPAAEMIALIQEIHNYVTLHDSDFVVIQEDAAALTQ